MKRLLLITLFFLFGALLSNAQGKFKIGANAGIPLGNTKNLTSFAIIADLNYYHEVSEDFEIAPSVGFIQAFGKASELGGANMDSPDIHFLPIALKGRVIAGKMWLQAGLGYAIGINDGNEGGFYYSPQLGYTISKAFALSLGYRAVTNKRTFDFISAGLLLGL